jgi:phenylpropionate dioxygenase-like ring-hydroxylating dioxygenase large terminal subunit
MPDYSSEGTPRTIDVDPESWAREFYDPQILAIEHERFAAAGIWHLLGLTSDIPGHDDWFTADIVGHSVFVQRFHNKIAAFENVCAHRFFPIRTEQRGHGTVRCGFHGWTYNAEGNAVAVPMCEELYGSTRAELGRKLLPVEIGICGGLIFGRLPAPPGDHALRPTLEAYLGAAEPALRRLTAALTPVGVIDMVVEANWKFCYHLTLDDYHIVAVHPETFGANGPVRPGSYRYFFDGEHSASFIHGDGVPEAAFPAYMEACKRGLPERAGYQIFQIFPNIFVSFAGGVVCVGRYTPLGSERTAHRAWFCQALEPGEAPFTPEQVTGCMEFARRNHADDGTAAERLQMAARQIWMKPAFSAQEERVAYFDRAYGALIRR